VNNAGLGDYGRFDAAAAARSRAVLELNVTALTLLTHALLPRLTRPAGILQVSSLGASLPVPELAVYAASKAYVSSFAEALAVELAPRGVTVTCLCPGPTPTGFSGAARRPGGPDTDRSGTGPLRMPPEAVVAAGLAALAAGRPSVHPGRTVAFAAWVFRVLPRPLLWALLRRRAARGGGG
jgi:short-subunit dehydrogenase